MKIRTTGLADSVYNETYWASFDYKPSMEAIMQRRNEFAKAANLKKWKGTHATSEAMWIPRQTLKYDHPEFYKCTLNFEPRYMFMFHDYGLTNLEVERYKNAGFQLLPDMYHELAKSFQANAETVKELVEIMKHPFVQRHSKHIVINK